MFWLKSGGICAHHYNIFALDLEELCENFGANAHSILSLEAF